MSWLGIEVNIMAIANKLYLIDKEVFALSREIYGDTDEDF